MMYCGDEQMENTNRRHTLLAKAIPLAAVLILLTACGGEGGEAAPPSSVNQNPQQTEARVSGSEENSPSVNPQGGKILIAYFTADENTEVDAVTSASVVTVDGEDKGRVRAVADMIQGVTGGDLFSIQTSVQYPADGGKLIDYASQEQSDDARPELTARIENLDSYDVIFIGYPTWWYDMPQVLYSFFDEYDFTGKTIIPFNVHNGSRFSGTINTIQKLEPGAAVMEDGFTVSERSVADAAGDVAEWLNQLGY